MQFGILGALEVVDGEEHLSLRSIQQRTLLALLLCHHGKVAHSDVLIDALWGAEAGDAGGARLRLQLHRLRRTLGDCAPILHRSAGYQLHVPSEAVDAWRFEDLVRQGRQAIATWNDARGSDLLRAALDMWRGPALSGLNDISLLRQHATRLEEQRLAALADRVEADLRLRRHGDLIPELSELVREHPLREKFRAQLMIALYHSGRQADALEVYRDGRDILSEDLGLEPSPELRRLQMAILAMDASLSLGPPPPAAPARGAQRRVHRRTALRHAPTCPHCARRVR
ncbi:AfsR/SARP family transcriptional regulator [Nonomuraea sp. LP-02]|uniref:AfsR/SARP family transcriptional regulator n=1 Tax=Nonomuraea sp. LP-02 TaxID=3097960 RepID=UPI002E3782A0|nr:AfsR/SARP family transcriptional regulator [Nonomuraea sp. LP-02]MED7925802.1 AfsR/SARP family transcriptional regulator [Nonomuraea sp. LP-02]